MLEARGLTKYYGSVPAVQGIDFSLEPGIEIGKNARLAIGRKRFKRADGRFGRDGGKDAGYFGRVHLVLVFRQAEQSGEIAFQELVFDLFQVQAFHACVI